MTWVSSQVLHGLQVATDLQVGVFSPLLEFFDWEDLVPETLQFYVRNLEAISNISLCMPMFIGTSLKRINLSALSDDPLYLTIVHSTAKRLSHLKELTIALGVDDGAAAFLRNYMDASPFESLETLAVYSQRSNSYISSPTLHVLATLPQLKSLTLHGLVDVIPLTSDAPLSGFRTLTILHISTERLSVLIIFLQCLTPDNALTKITITTTDDDSTLQFAIDTISVRCNPLALQSLEINIHEDGSDDELEEQLELDVEGGLDNTSLLALKKLTELSLLVTGSIRLTPNLVALFPTAWPTLQTLKLESMFPSSHIPFINHSHFLTLIQDLPNLEQLAIRFDATRVTGHEVVPGAPFYLKALGVGDSPISSPSRVLAFLKANVSLPHVPTFPQFRSWKTPVFHERWQAVQRSWKN